MGCFRLCFELFLVEPVACGAERSDGLGIRPDGLLLARPFESAAQPSGRSESMFGHFGLSVRTDPSLSGRSRQSLPRFECLMI